MRHQNDWWFLLKSWSSQRCFYVGQQSRKSRTGGNLTRFVRIQMFPSQTPNKCMRSCSKCSTVGTPTTSRDTWRPTGNRPNCSVVVDSEQFNGWQQLHDSYVNGYPNRVAMGFIQPKRIQVKLLKSDLALGLTWWSASFPTSQRTVVGTSTMNLQKFDDGWKIVASHTSISDL